MTFEDFLNMNPFSLSREEKEKALTERLLDLTRFHQTHCPAYANML